MLHRSRATSLTDLSERVWAGKRFKVVDAETGENITQAILSQLR